MPGGVVAPISMTGPRGVEGIGLSFLFLGRPFCPEPAPLKNVVAGWWRWLGIGLWCWGP